jgi:adenylate cyclase
MSPDLLHEFRVGPWKVEPLRGTITGPDGEVHHLEPKVMDVFVCLAEHPNDLVTRDELLGAVWGENAVSDEPLTRVIGELRRALHDDPGHPKYIKTVPKRGYGLIGKVHRPESSTEKPVIERQQPDISTTTSDGSRFFSRRIVMLGPIGLIALIVFYFVFEQFVVNGETTNTFDAELSIAVLPFADLSPEGDQEYFSDGISEEILNVLTQIPDLYVISRSSAFSFKGKNVQIPNVAKQLGVTHVLQGSVRKSGNRIRITTQLINARTDRQLWSETYDRELENVFAIQDEIAAAVVSTLKITLLGREVKAAETNPEAYRLYLQGRYFFNQFAAASNKQAETLLKQALAIDPDFAPAWTVLGKVYQHQSDPFDIRPHDEANELARDAIQKALTIDPQYGRAYAALAVVEMEYDFDFTAASQHLQQALKLNSGDALILLRAGQLNTYLGRLHEAIDLYRQSIALDPVSYFGHINLGLTYYAAHRLDEAADSLQMALSLKPSGIFPQYLLGKVLLAQGDAPAALAAMEQETMDFFRLIGTAIVQHALGDAGASDAALQESIEMWGAGGAYQVAEVYAYRGEIDHAFDWLELAYENHDGGLIYVLVDPLLTNVHDDPRWEPFLNKMGLPH